MKPKLSRHIKLNHTNITLLLLQEATQRYQKLTDYLTKCCYLFALLSAYCDLRFLCFLSGRVFSVLGHSIPQILNVTGDHSCRILVSFSGLKMAFSKLSPAKYHCLYKKPCLQ